MSESDQGKIACELFDEVKRLQAEIFELNKPRPWLRAEEVREEGLYWWRFGIDKPEAVEVVIEDTKVFVQYFCCYDRDLLTDFADDRDRFQRIPEPELPEVKG